MKSKGISGERELLHAFWAADIPCIRVAGSGSMKYPCPDVLIGRKDRKIAIECKVCKGSTQYFTKDEISDLEKFCGMFGAEAYVGVKFNHKGWKIIKVDALVASDKFFVVKSDSEGLTLDAFIKEFSSFIEE
tara:strand:- start:562 stop:957 length:396 start_codon:yes stop_codon:yes gene_type:complete